MVGLRRRLHSRQGNDLLSRGQFSGLYLPVQLPSPAPEIPHWRRDLVGLHEGAGRQWLAIAPELDDPGLHDPEEADEIILRDSLELAGDLRAGRVHLQARDLLCRIAFERLFRAANPPQPLDPDFGKQPRAHDRERGDAARPAFVYPDEPPLHRNIHRGCECFYREPSAGHPVTSCCSIFPSIRSISCFDVHFNIFVHVYILR